MNTLTDITGRGRRMLRRRAITDEVSRRIIEEFGHDRRGLLTDAQIERLIAIRKEVTARM